MDMFGDDDDVVNEGEEEEGAKRSAACGVLAFHNGTENALFLFLERRLTAIAASYAHTGGGDASADTIRLILSLVDEFCVKRHWMMCVGPEKGLIVRQAVLNHFHDAPRRPLCFVEIGSYCGYSALQLALAAMSLNELKKEESREGHWQFRIYCIESEAECVSWTRRMATLAHLTEKEVVVLHNTRPCSMEKVIEEQLRPLLLADGFSHIDVLFIDHDKQLYLTDLRTFEASQLLVSNSFVIADNVLSFDQPMSEYLEHVQQKAIYSSSDLIVSTVEYANEEESANANMTDGVSISVFKGV